LTRKKHFWNWNEWLYLYQQLRYRTWKWNNAWQVYCTFSILLNILVIIWSN